MSSHFLKVDIREFRPFYYPVVADGGIDEAGILVHPKHPVALDNAEFVAESHVRTVLGEVPVVPDVASRIDDEIGLIHVLRIHGQGSELRIAAEVLLLQGGVAVQGVEEGYPVLVVSVILSNSLSNIRILVSLKYPVLS